MNVGNLLTPQDYQLFWQYLHWALEQAAPFLLIVIAAFVVSMIIKQVIGTIVGNKADNINQDFDEEDY